MQGYLKCLDCGSEYPIQQDIITCPKCGGLLEIIVEPKKDFSFSKLKGKGVWRYRELIAGEYKHIVSLNEGNTPLIASSTSKNLYFKFEGANPTGSFKDRGMTVAISSAKSLNYKVVVAASTGNTAASAAAYASRAGLRSYIVLPKGKVALGKLAQSILYGTTILEVDGSFDVAMNSVMKLYRELKIVYPLNSFNPWRLEGQKTIAFEIVEDIGVPDNVIVPVGNAGNIYAIWKGFVELMNIGVTDKVPRMIGIQAEGAAPIAKALEKGLDKPEFIDSPETVASAIRIGKPVNWKKAIKAIKSSNGFATYVSDSEILEAQKELARREGIGAEPASAASYAGYLKLVNSGKIDKSEKTVLILTGHALKDPDAMIKAESRRILVNPEHINEIILSDLK
ncbi:threonine synthase [Sulfurisphaera ohwakuensis]|uniref:Threonine synthase n=1 Tax=Sulfurisphaera ohwakuensis TaxID=69656 RepID=A0A650CGW3_SULOH|nr:threonine synthase [Sulfurisphaera ohwakuensis]MBB5252568.1 threonine synthase [Sulfurisphaera ohwakuensis]QGR16988.1 threonine synthase [Sulfurisphaera ohwakuensis]